MIHEVVIDGVIYIPKGAIFRAEKIKILRALFGYNPDDYRYDESLVRMSKYNIVKITDSGGDLKDSADNVADRIVTGLLKHEEKR